MARAKRKLAKGVIATIVTATVAIILLLAIVITDFFVPVKYLTAYLVKKENLREGALRITFIDVDFGDCALVELPDGKNILIDCGDVAYPNTLRVFETLNRHGVDKIDYLICTSVKDEHCGGFDEVLKHKGVEHAFIPYSSNKRITNEFYHLYSRLEEKGAKIDYASVGEGISGGQFNYFVTFLSPVSYKSPSSEYAEMNKTPNTANIENASAVVWLEYLGNAIIFTSDARPEALKRIVEDYNLCAELNQPYCSVGGRSVKLSKCFMVTAPAHAGKANTYAPFYDLIKPEQTIISVGKNFAGYPSAVALSDICNYCTPLYTSHDGNITVTIDEKGYNITKNK